MKNVDNSRKLSKNDLGKLAKWAKSLANKAADFEPDVILEMLAEKYEQHSALPIFRNKPKNFIVSRAKSSVTNTVMGIGGLTKISAIALGPAGGASNYSASDEKRSAPSDSLVF